MSQDIYIITEDKFKPVADELCNQMLIKKVFISENMELTEDILISMAKNCPVEYFYVISTDKDISFPSFDFSFKPQEWDSEYVHIWNNDKTVRLFNKKLVLSNPARYTDKALREGTVKLKHLIGKLYVYPVFDIIFLGYDETYAEENYNRLKARFPRAKRLHNIKGIMEAHMSAARWADYDKSEMFYVVDADAEILPTFEFDYQVPFHEKEIVHVWHSHNPVNDLEYGYGGIKLFPTKKLLEYTGSPIDFTTSVSKNFKVIPIVSNVTHFNTDPFSAWKSGFRECAKLASKLIPNQDNTETEERLRIWCSVGEDREFGDFTIMGANEGAEFGRTYANQPDMLGLINDFEWLEKKFSD